MADSAEIQPASALGNNNDRTNDLLLAPQQPMGNREEVPMAGAVMGFPVGVPVVEDFARRNNNKPYRFDITVDRSADTCVSSVTEDIVLHARHSGNGLYPSMSTCHEAEEPDPPGATADETDTKPAAIPTTQSDTMDMTPATLQQEQLSTGTSLVDMENRILGKNKTGTSQQQQLSTLEGETPHPTKDRTVPLRSVAIGVDVNSTTLPPLAEALDTVESAEKTIESTEKLTKKQNLVVESGEESNDETSNVEPSLWNPGPVTEPGAFPVSTPGFSSSVQLAMEAMARSSTDTAPTVSLDTAPTVGPVTLDATLAPTAGHSGTVRTARRNRATASRRDEEHGYVVEAKVEPDSTRDYRTYFWLGAILVLVVVVVLLSLGLAGVFADSEQEPDSNNSMNQSSNEPIIVAGTLSNGTVSQKVVLQSRLEQVRIRGYLKCSRIPNPDSMQADPDIEKVGEWTPSFCYAIAAAIWGSTNKTDLEQRVQFLEVGLLVGSDEPADVVPVGISRTMTGNVYNAAEQSGQAMSTPFIFDGYRVSGDPFYVDCFDNKSFKHVGECSDLLFCVSTGSTWARFVHEVLPERKIKDIDSFDGVMQSFAEGGCNIFMTFGLGQSEVVIRDVFGYYGNYTLGSKLYTRETRVLVTQADDPQWSSFVDVVLQSLLEAEMHNITQATAHLMPRTTVFGEDYSDMFKHVIRAMGNYGEIHQRYLYPILPRETINMINDGTTGMLYAPELGVYDPVGDYNRQLGPRLQRVLDRGRVLCGVRFGRDGFAAKTNSSQSSGIDVDFCRAVGAALFGGDTRSVELVQVEGQKDGFMKLASGAIDVLAGATWNLANSVNEPGTGLGFAFSLPYYYAQGLADSMVDPNLCLATMQDDHDWKTFVYWTMVATIYAEEHDIHRLNHNEMPMVHVYGDGLRRMLRDAILGVGNYADIFSRNLENRSGRNLLNQGADPGPGLYPMLDIFV
ncbi:extracellular solute-binding protein [Seminavis robusta]|uniref:Extracellular solute-binding protein n=1 Tax=Seminavis robusta TaxID=568900 RepID=A0A9N8HR91_9STRA|nr:extracellular solute-binding protein [Seminavis robusta]|eukprot:Sro1291_g259870.1 extracellular solute-binding protein (961) ;mRNA; r:702-3678